MDGCFIQMPMLKEDIKSVKIVNSQILKKSCYNADKNKQIFMFFLLCMELKLTPFLIQKWEKVG